MTSALQWQILFDGDLQDPLLDKLDKAPSKAIPRILKALRTRALRGGSSAMNDYAIGLDSTGRENEAIRIWEALVAHDTTHLTGWLNLATAQARRGDFDQAAETLQRARSHLTGTAELRGIDRRLEELEHVRTAAERQMRLLEGQAAALRERLDLGIAEPGDSFRLARLLIGLVEARGSTVTGDEVLAAARRARADSPGDARALEVLVAALLRAGEQAELDEVLHDLETIAPHSKALTAVRSLRSDPSVVRDGHRHYQRGNELVRRAWEGDRDAEAELRELSRRFPRNQNYRVGLMMAACGRKDWSTANRLADGLAAEPDVPHETHFHLAQYYWFAGQRDRSLHHFGCAYALARDDADREDVRAAMRVVGAGTLEDLPRG